MSKTIEIRKVHIRNIILSFLLGFGILFGLEHFGKFSYIADSPTQNSYEKPSLVQYLPISTKILSIYYKSYFGNTVETGGNGFDISDMNYSDTDFKKYSVKSYYYTQATLVDFKYGVYISLGIFLITTFFTNFKIKLT